MTVETHRKGNNGCTSKIVAVLMLTVFVAGVAVASNRGDQENGPTLLDLFSAPGCYVPLIGLTLVVLFPIALGGYYAKQRLDAGVRVWQARAAREEALAEKQRLQTHDLTPGPDGRELARLVHGPDGRVSLVNPRVAAAAVTTLDPDAAVRPDQTSEQLALAAVLGDALGRAARGGVGRGGRSPDALLLGAALGRPAIEARVPPTVRVLSAEESRLLESGREE
ncbi:MAG: hypothetical protein PVF45_09820 [Anaerolineae bacterium]|jgi:hypothetical protein